jgi:hypothetical protein
MKMGILEMLKDFEPPRRREPKRRESAPLSCMRDEEFSFETEWRLQAEESFSRAAEAWYIVRPGPDPDKGTTLVPPRLLKVLTADAQTFDGTTRVVTV